MTATMDSQEAVSNIIASVLGNIVQRRSDVPKHGVILQKYMRQEYHSRSTGDSAFVKG